MTIEVNGRRILAMLFVALALALAIIQGVTTYRLSVYLHTPIGKTDKGEALNRAQLIDVLLQKTFSRSEPITTQPPNPVPKSVPAGPSGIKE